MSREIVPQLRHPCSAAELHERLATLRDTLDFLRRWADAGAELRRHFQQAGSPIWESDDDLLWERWITTYGDERMQQYLADLDAAVHGEDAKGATTCANDEIAPF